nr:MAG TPA: hypothetical protein [Caudoviricetes sp.]
MIIYSRFWLFLSCSRVQLAPIRGAASEQWQKYVPFWNRCTTALFGFLTAVYIPSENYSLIGFAGVVGVFRTSVIGTWKIPGTGPQVVRSLLQNWSYWL